MKKALIITYYWPPAGGGGVQRWLKFSKYMRQYGWEPIIYTHSNGEMAAVDETLIKQVPKGIEVLKTPIWEPFHIYKFLIGKKQTDKVYSGVLVENKKKSVMQNFSLWVRGNFFIPDAKCFWIKPSIKFLTQYISENNIDAIISTGPPHTTHMIALGLKKHFSKLPWIADFRDPWTNVDYWDQLHLSNWAEGRHKAMEKKILQHANKVVTVSWSWATDFINLGVRKDIDVITNGYDEADFNADKKQLSPKFTITHIGSMNADRNPHVFWKALKNIIETNPNFESLLEIRLIGPLDHAITVSLEQYGLLKYVNKTDFMPHSEAIKNLCNSQVLLLPINNTPNAGGVLPGKLYEYLGAQRPIICITEGNTDSARIMHESGAASICGYSDVALMEKIILDLFAAFQTGNLSVPKNNIENFSRKNLCGQFCDLLNSIS
nr:glycosyltransferase family 4 protein [Bacteroidota bacterium]